uniref:WGS project CAEQ00000000 data, annotated contig 699 n=1 Tax=Trypanosoma congolense (strain IL3000) TaxID=1068625 RepID=F9WHW5_TRYCI|nr:unnamed protein product [Trypanosoma congolense IL3000]
MFSFVFMLKLSAFFSFFFLRQKVFLIIFPHLILLYIIACDLSVLRYMLISFLSILLLLYDVDGGGKFSAWDHTKKRTMPGMRLDFLNNVSQRAATGRSMPLHQVEAVVLYGKPEQRGKVIQKVLANAYALCLNKTTHYLLHTVLERCDNNIGVQVLFQLRRKIVDLSHSPVGNIIVQEMIDKLPVRQKKEIAEMFVLNTEEDEFRQLCQHPFGNRVAQKIIENSITCEIVEERLVPFLWHLAVHPHGQRAVASYIDSTEEGWRQVCKAILGLSENVLEEGGSQTSKVAENAKEGCSSEGKSDEYALIKQVSRLFRANTTV